MASIHNLEQLLLCSKYRCILDDAGKPVVPKSSVYKELSSLLKDKISPKYIYTIILENRHGLYEKLLHYHNLDKLIKDVSYTSTDTFTDNSGLFNDSSTDKDINFEIIIPFKTWHNIDYESVIYKSSYKVQRSYNTLRRRRWTNIIFDLIYKTTKLPCAFLFKRCKMSEVGIYITVYAKCPDCKCNLIGKIINKPKDNTDVRMECCVTNYNADITHKHYKKRPLNGEKREEISQSLATGTLSATTWRRQEAPKIMNLYDPEPPHLYEVSILRKTKQEKQDRNLQIEGSCAYSNLQNMKYMQHAGSIHCIGYDPFFVHYWTPEQITIYLEYHDVLYIDATGSLIKKLTLPNGELSPHIYLYQAVTNTVEYKMPVFQMLSAVQNINAIQYWLNEFLRIGSIRKAGFPIPRSVVCDFDMALLNAIAKAFGQYSNLKNYLDACFTLILKEHSVEKPKCFIRLDICHYMHMVSRWKCLLQLNPMVKKFYIRAMALLTKQTNFFRFVELAKCIFTLSLSEEIGNDTAGNNSLAESARIIIVNNIKGIPDMSHDDKNVKDEQESENEELHNETKDCNIGKWANNLLEECRKTLTKTVIVYDMANPYYCPQLSQKLKTLLSYFPLYSGIMIPIFGYGQINASSSAVESEMNDIKNILLKNQTRPMRADKFVVTHLNSFAGRSLLAMAKHDLISNKNEQITENNVIIPSINETEDIVPSTSEISLSGNISRSPIMFQKSKLEADTDSLTNIRIDFYNSEKSDITPDDPSDLNLQHNWRNKNEPKSKRKTYLDTCPDWDLSNLKKNRIGIANIQNGNLCTLMFIDKKRVVRNTCGFDSIVCILASACIHQFYRNIIKTSDSNIMKFIKCLLDNGCCQKTYMSRAEILMKINNFRSEIDKNIVTVDCYSSIGNVVQYIFQSSPSYSEKKYCNVCSKIIVRQSPLVPININLIEQHGLTELSNAILEGMPKNNSVCCEQLMQRYNLWHTNVYRI